MSTGEDQTAEATTVAADEPRKMALDVEVQTVGPCRKHIRVRIPRDDIDFFKTQILGKYTGQAAVPGFRVGHVPEALVERRFKKELGEEMRQALLLQSLEQLSEEHQLDPINEPNLDVESITIPDEGDFEYEFEVEVRPEFDLPAYEGLKIERPVRTVSEEEIDKYLDRFLGQYGQTTTVDGPAEPGDIAEMDIEFHGPTGLLRRSQDLQVKLAPVLAFQDGELSGFDELMTGVKAGETREATIKISQESEHLEMRGEDVKALFHVAEIRRPKAPEINEELLERIGVVGEAELRDEVRTMLERQVTYRQRQSTREQVLEKITESADWDLPEDLVRAQVENALRREILEMQQAGFTTAEIRARENELRQNSLTTTRQALKEHFVLDKIATQEGVEVMPGDIDTEISMMAFQRGENPRRVRARLIKSGMIENLEAQIRERKAVDFVLSKAEFVDVEMPVADDSDVEALSISICGGASAVPSASDADDEDGGDEA